MVQQLWGDIERLKAEVARLRGKLDSIAVGNQVLLNPNTGNNPLPPADPGSLTYGTAASLWGRREIGSEGDVLQVQSGFPVWDAPPASSLPTGGTTGQALAKDSGTDGDATWHDIEFLSTAEMDDTLVLAPDGAGGVEFRAETGSGTPSATVEDETTYGITPDAGVSSDYSRGDHTHGSPAEESARMPHNSGQYYGGLTVQFTPTTASYIANFIRAVPFYVPISGSYDRAALEIQAVGAGNHRIGVWGPIPSTGDISSLPLLLDTGSINTSTTGIKTATISLTLAQGWYVLGQVSDSTNTLRAYPAGALLTEIGDTVPFGATRTRSYWFAAFTYGALPNPITTLAPAGDADLMPMVQLRRT